MQEVAPRGDRRVRLGSTGRASAPRSSGFAPRTPSSSTGSPGDRRSARLSERRRPRSRSRKASLGAVAVRDRGLLASGRRAPGASAFGEDAYPTFAGKAAALMHSLARNHALVDGNKRLAWAATRVFCLLNGRDLQYTVDEAEALARRRSHGRPGRARDRAVDRLEHLRTAGRPSPAQIRAGVMALIGLA